MPLKGVFKSKYKRKDNRTYKSWSAMIRRCYSTNDSGYRYYGGRGISVSKAWHNYDNFHDDMAASHHLGLTLERINNNSNYSKKNCRWASRKEQNCNKRNSRKFTNPETGEVKTLNQWAEYFGITRSTASARANKLKIKDFDIIFHSGRIHRGKSI